MVNLGMTHKTTTNFPKITIVFVESCVYLQHGKAKTGILPI